MLTVNIHNYDSFELDDNTIVSIRDHMNGFDQSLKNSLLDRLQSQNKKSLPITVYTEIIPNDKIRTTYPYFNFKYDLSGHAQLLDSLQGYRVHPELTFSNFLCSFNGTPHVSRKLLVSILRKFGYFDGDYCSKNFSYTDNALDGHLVDIVGERARFFRKFFVNNDHGFPAQIYDLSYQRYDHENNILKLEKKLTDSFLHLVSESIATSYYPNISEKSFYSIVTRGLFLSYAQPNWHAYLEKYYGFKRYTRIFDYHFDSIQNPVERLLELMSMISKFQTLSPDDWKDLYLLEQDTIEHNYDHYFSQDYQKYFANYQ